MLPALIEVSPPRGPKESKVVVPGSKSITNRALSWRRSPARPPLAAPCGAKTPRRWSIAWSGWASRCGRARPRRAGQPHHHRRRPRRQDPGRRHARTPLELFVDNAGTAARFLTALLCLGRGSYRLSGVPRMHERPQAALFEALRALGYRIDAPGGKLPAIIHGTGPRPGARPGSASRRARSSRPPCCWRRGSAAGRSRSPARNADELPYVEMTRALMEVFPAAGGPFAIEPDASSGSYFWGADLLLRGDAAAASRSCRLASVRHAGRPSSCACRATCRCARPIRASATSGTAS